MKKLQDAIASVKNERMGEEAKNHLDSFLESVELEDDLPEAMEYMGQAIVEYFAGIQGEPSEIKKFARKCTMAFEEAVEYEINNPEMRRRS